jgi:4'-phosphopantetheinyl transferase
VAARVSTVDVWRVALDQPAPVVARLAVALEGRELARARAFRLERDRARHVVAHAALRDVLARHCHQRAADLRFATTAAGKPVLASAGPWFNLSHSHGHALVAVARDGPVGVDIERVAVERDEEGIAARFFTPTEQRMLAAVDGWARRRLFVRIWTCKECCVKEDGRGIGGIESVSVELDADGRLSARDAAGPWALGELDPVPGYAGCVASRGEPVVARLLTWLPPAAASWAATISSQPVAVSA